MKTSDHRMNTCIHRKIANFLIKEGHDFDAKTFFLIIVKQSRL